MDFSAYSTFGTANTFGMRWDMLLVFAFLAGGFFYGVFAGRARLLACMLSLYASIPLSQILVSLIPPPLFVKDFFPTTLFIIVVGIVSTLFYVSFFHGRRFGDSGWWQILIASFLATGLFVSELGRLLPLSLRGELSELVFNFMLSDMAYAVWLFLPLVGIYIVGRSKVL